VRQNIEFGLENERIPKAEWEEIVGSVLEMVGLQKYAHWLPSKLSCGQRQRVALARAVSKKPRVFPIDEPPSTLDAKLRNQMRTELIELHQKLDRVFTAQFIGDPGMNVHPLVNNAMFGFRRREARSS